jgi:hypothetical protein
VKKEGGAFYGAKRKQNISIAVIRVNKADQIVNARPCINCLSMMKAVNINKVYYSVSDTELVCEKITDMVSIHVSATTRQYNMSKKYNIVHYYEKILSTYLPTVMKEYNLKLFIKYNLEHLLPTYKCVINNAFATIYNNNNVFIIKCKII